MLYLLLACTLLSYQLQDDRKSGLVVDGKRESREENKRMTNALVVVNCTFCTVKSVFLLLLLFYFYLFFVVAVKTTVQRYVVYCTNCTLQSMLVKHK